MRRAVTAHERGDYGRAEIDYRTLVHEFPDFAEAWHFYGLLRYQRGDGDAALECLRRAQALKPDEPTFLLNFGRVLIERGEYRHALACLERARRAAPDNLLALELLARALLALERGGEAVAELERRCASGQAQWTLWMLLGNCREQGGDRPGALTAFAEARRLAPPGELMPSIRRAEVALHSGRTELAESEYGAVLAADPHCGAALLGMANLAAQAGEFERGAELAGEALRRDFRMYGAWLLLAGNPCTVHDDAFLSRLELAAKEADGDPDSWPLHFALGEEFERREEFDRAFDSYSQGNRLQSGGRSYRLEAQEAYVRDILTALDRDFVERAARVGIRGAPRIFVCGMPRSGTTLVETILASHPDVAAGGEMRHIHDRLRREIGVKGLAGTGTWLRSRSDANLRAIAAEWNEALKEAAHGRPIVTDKMPSNYYILGLIQACFPDSVIVHVRRDALDNAVSCYTTSFHEGNVFANSLEGIGHCYLLHDRLMEHWHRTLDPGRIIEIGYESLVSDPDRQIRRLIESVGLTWDPACLAFHRHRRSVRTASLYQVRRPLYGRSVGRWRRFEKHLAPLIEALARPLSL